ncbi:MAG: phenylalanine--tRNA ligase subunit beta [Candidatus Methanomethylicota archaeon]|uniref:Phenylalanine--tRNA ligase beta subunit n=1 Tax=Thermoproteota archaeon TaxID=2056631 RepID=A0A520KHY0_9CREN|nr:MAG: phenylalanine--tRNA ligase subunit beta [Candidatus Verstraetearchaeota archaeon]TDA38072.1 MAG: phenylalanine--tRNA ligase subunit beta [Candidatus Verstraetearchaeota archaeon]
MILENFIHIILKNSENGGMKLPKISISINDLKKILKMNISNEKIIDVLPRLKCEIEEIIGDRITLEITSDRADFFSSEGIARGIRIYYGNKWKLKDPLPGSIKLFVDSSVESIRPYIVGAVIRNIELDEEAIVQIMQLQEKIHNTYGSNRRKASIGVYDLDKISPPIYYSAFHPNDIKFIPLGYSEVMNGYDILNKTNKGIEYGWIIKDKEKFPLLYDSNNVVLSMPPIINSENTKVTTNTKNLFIDITGTDENTINICLNVIVTSVLERGGDFQYVDVYYKNKLERTPKLEYTTTSLKLSTINNSLGININLNDITYLLNKMGHEVKEIKDNEIIVISPPYRVDILHEIDLVEDIAMAIGLENIKPEVPKIITIGKLLRESKVRRIIRDIMIGMGFQEVITYMLSSKSVMEDKPLLEKREFVELINPVSSEYEVLRDCLLPKLLQFLSYNTHEPYPQKIFEYGDVVYVENGVAKISTHLAAAISDYKVSYEDIQAVVVALFKAISKNISFKPYNKPPFIEGRAAEIILDGKSIGIVGEISPRVLVNFGLEFPVGIFECDINKFIF